MDPIPVIDVFAGPGGLNEGFSSVMSDDGSPVFKTARSYEIDPIACKTLQVRSAFRQLQLSDRGVPESYYMAIRDPKGLDRLDPDDPTTKAIEAAKDHVRCEELGRDRESVFDDIRQALKSFGRSGAEWILVGGPPCQAYSLVGRSRRKSDPTFEQDSKHTLYREYLEIIQELEPAVFVMENVKGMLSSKHDGGLIVQQILEDLRGVHRHTKYELRSLAVEGADSLAPRDFVIRAEEYGVPQKRHRVIILGLRSDLAGVEHDLLVPALQRTVGGVIGGMPRIRSQVSPRSRDSFEAWENERRAAWALGQLHGLGVQDERARRRVEQQASQLSLSLLEKGGPWVEGDLGEAHTSSNDDLDRWLSDSRMGAGFVQHEGRAHMPADLRRYGFLAKVAADLGRSPNLRELAAAGLLPEHENASRLDAPFADRFRVQLANAPSSTVTSHIAKDGHYYIHPDPGQMRSLTVREAARLQTFPDNYIFLGNRTQQYHQVGNAVPPYLARQLAEVVAGVLGIGVAPLAE